MQALYRNNHQAFVNNNINHLKEGQYIRIPSFREMMSIDPQIAQKQANKAEKSWRKQSAILAKKLGETSKLATEQTVKKKDLDAAKKEINNKLQTFGNKQQEKLTNIQQDVLDSIDGLQAILKENQNLRDKLGSFNNKLEDLQTEIAKNKQLKLQMDDLLALQKELLAKAKAREQQLLVEKQQAELTKNDFTSSILFTI